MWILLVIAFVFAMIMSVRFRLVVLHPISVIMYTFNDVYYYFRNHEYDRFEGGHLNCYEAHFGGGKTLTMVHDALKLYKRYNNKRIFDRHTGKWVTQKVIILSNVKINDCPGYQHLAGLKEFVECARHNEALDKKHDTRTCVIGCIDEASVMLNSRHFKSNIDYGFLNTLLTCRHFAIDLFTTSQKFRLQDALLRSVTQKVIRCEKKWRLVTKSFYDADEMENASNLTLIKPLGVTGYFCKNSDYKAYDTYAVVDELQRDTMTGKMRTEEEILALRGDFYSDNDAIVHASRKLKKLRKRA